MEENPKWSQLLLSLGERESQHLQRERDPRLPPMHSVTTPRLSVAPCRVVANVAHAMKLK